MSVSILRKHLRFGKVTATDGGLGERKFRCVIYQVKDGAQVEYRNNKIMQYKGTLFEDLNVVEEIELQKGFIPKNMKDALRFIANILANELVNILANELANAILHNLDVDRICDYSIIVMM